MRLIDDQLARLHRLPAHGNRQVFFDHVVVAHLLAFFNPHLRGLRGLEDFFNEPRVRQRYGAPRMPKSTLADVQRLFDPQMLLPLIASLTQQARLTPHDPRLDVITRQLLAVDGSFFAVAPRIAWAVSNGYGQGHVRAHVHFDILRGIPLSATLTDGQASEAEQLRAALRSPCFYLIDRGFQQYRLLADILAVDSDFLVRLRKSAAGAVSEVRPLTAADQAAGIKADELVTLGWRADQAPPLPPLRRVRVRYTRRDGQPGELQLLTNRTDLPAWMIALLYQHRWQIELFFRWLKCVANFKHFFSQSIQAMTLQVYVTLIGLLLIAIETGTKPSSYDFSLLCAAANGLMSLESALEIATQRRAERARAAQWQRQYNAKKKAAKKIGL